MNPIQGDKKGWIGAALLGAVLGPAIQLQQPHLWAWQDYALLIAAGLALLLLAARAPSKLRALLLVLAATLLSYGSTGERAIWFTDRNLDAGLEGRDIAVIGTIAAMPQSSELGTRFRFDVEQARLGDAPVRLPPRLLLGWYGGAQPGADATFDLERQPADLHAGERWQMTVRLKAPHGNLNPHGFDYELWLWEQGVQATGYVRAGPKDPAPERIGSSWAHPIEQMRHRVRDAIFRRVADRSTAGVLAALVVGDQSAIERSDWDVFRATGVAHLMSISGLHVTMFAWAAALAVGALWRRSRRLCLAWPAQHAALVGGVLLAASYAAFSGWGVPAQRTVWMLATAAVLRLGARQWPWPWLWLLVCAVVVTIDPWALTQPGFWLSFVAVGVLFATDAGQPAVRTDPAQREQDASGRWMVAIRRAGARAVALLREQWVVTLALTPLSLLLFNQVSLVGLVANLFAIPWVTLVITPLALAGVLVTPLWDVAAGALAVLSAALAWLASLPVSTVSVAAPPLWAGVVGVAGGLLLAMRLPWSLRALGVPLLLPVLLWQAPRPAAGEFELLAADVGQGNAVIVRTAHHTLVYDSGPRYSLDTDAGQRILLPLLRAFDERVDVLVLSHRDTDHTGGAVAILGMQAKARLLSSIESDHELQALRPAARCEAGQRWQWDGVAFEVLHPAADNYTERAKPNSLSCVLRVQNGRRTVLLAGDIERPQELRLVAEPHAIKADVLLVPHHGSKTSSSDAFLDAVQPSVALVQAGYRNRFGHPAAPVVQRYREHGIALIESQRCGAAYWSSTQGVQVRCERDYARRYWHHVSPR